MIKNVFLGLTIAALLSFVALALMGSTVSAWYVVAWIVPTLFDQIASRAYDMT
jgi:uncharacterized membrane protein YgaE (UPF0421/DUF939 family)